MGKNSLKIYFAGDLFDAKDLGGNLMLADAINRLSGSRYCVMLPQDGECEVKERTSQSIRDADFKLLFECDCVVANFDGTDLDSGTVAEFCFAKSVDMPTVLLRTDFRDSGDHTLPDGEPWNLMCSHFPRTAVLHINGMVRYHHCREYAQDISALLTAYYNSIAQEIIQKLDSVCAMDSWLKEDMLYSQYCNTVKSIGGTLGKLFNEASLPELIEHKKQSGLFK